MRVEGSVIIGWRGLRKFDPTLVIIAHPRCFYEFFPVINIFSKQSRSQRVQVEVNGGDLNRNGAERELQIDLY
jgi:hypothetical protein